MRRGEGDKKRGNNDFRGDESKMSKADRERQRRTEQHPLIGGKEPVNKHSVSTAPKNKEQLHK